jgi:hypothetical protein
MQELFVLQFHLVYCHVYACEGVCLMCVWVSLSVGVRLHE